MMSSASIIKTRPCFTMTVTTADGQRMSYTTPWTSSVRADVVVLTVAAISVGDWGDVQVERGRREDRGAEG